MNIEETDKYQPISDYYSGKSILVTGGTGFLGSVLIEKLLYSCPDVGHIYVLVREKKEVLPEQRVTNLIDSSPVFDRLKAERPENLKKIIPIVGDLTKSKLGISIRDLQTLQKEVSVVFHFAATVKFNEPLSVAVKINVEGVDEMINICRGMEKIETLLYMSTIFSNTTYEVEAIVEELYPRPKPMDEVYSLIKENDPSETFSPKVLCRPNTYTFTKAIAENNIAEKCGDFHAIIIRPSIVTAAKDEPMEGWLANWMGPTPILAFIAKGWVRCLYGKDHYPVAIIPVDYVVNLSIIAAAKHSRSNKLSIYNLCSSKDNKITLKDTRDGILKESSKENFNDLPWPGTLFTTSEWLLFLIRFLFQTIPIYTADFILFLCGKPPRCVKILKQLEKCMAAVKFFTSRNWVMDISRTKDLISTLSENDKRKFPCNPSDINWDDYMAGYFRGIKKYLLKIENKKV